MNEVSIAEINASRFFRATKRDSINTITTTAIDTVLCVMLFLPWVTGWFEHMTMWLTLLVALVTGTICVVRFRGFKRFFKTIESNNLSQRTLSTLKAYQKMFDKSSLVLSFFDIVTTLAICIYMGLEIGNMAYAVAIRGTVMAVRAGNNAVQLGKLLRSMRIIAVVSGTYALARGKHFMKKEDTAMKKLWKWIKSNPRTLAAIGSILAAGVTMLLAWVGNLNAPEFLLEIITGGLTALGAIFAGWAGFEFTATADARKAKEAEAKASAKKEVELEKMAEEQLKIEQKAAEEAKANAEAARKAQIVAQLKAEVERKNNTTIV